MPTSSDLRLNPSFQSRPARQEAVVQDRPTLGAMPLARRGAGWWLLPGVDFVSSSAVLALIAILSGASVLPALPVAPLVLVLVYSFLGVYGANPSGSALSSADGIGWAGIRRVGAAPCRALIAPYVRSLSRQERWVLVGDEATSERLRAYAPLAEFATVVGTVPPAENDDAGTNGRVAALEVAERYHADRVVISSQHADDEGLLELGRAFKPTGVPFSLLPRPLDLLEAQAVTRNRVGGVPLIEVEALAAHDAVPYDGPDRRATRSTKVSVAVPAMNEGKNIGHALERLPECLHEVILVDGNSKDDTVEAARQAYPGIRVTTQSGRGKGDAFRTGFAAVTGNLVVMLDADGSADPAEIPRFVAALEAGADFAKGSRYLDGGGSADITWTRQLGNTCLSGTANLLHGTHFTDLCYGYNAFWARCLPFIALDVPGFEVETLINLRIAGAGMKITEVPSYEEERISGDSNLKTFSDGFRVLGTILSESRRSRSIHRERLPKAAAETQEAEATASVA